MKISNRILLIAFAVFILICCGLLIAARTVIHQATDIHPLSVEEREIEILEYSNFNAFSRISIAG